MSFYPPPRPMVLGRVPSGREGIKATLQAMSRLVRVFKKDAGVREIATRLCNELPQYDNAGAVRALHAFVRDSIRYTNDPTRVEWVQTPKATLELESGDCDDKATLLAALLESIGRPTRFAALGFSDGGPHSHVLVEVRAGRSGRWVPLETIKPVPAGWGPKGIKRTMVAHN